MATKRRTFKKKAKNRSKKSSKVKRSLAKNKRINTKSQPIIKTIVPTIQHLNEIIKTQSRLAMANFNINTFMNLVVDQMQQLTAATGVVIELVAGDEMVYRAATGTVAAHIGLRLPIASSISGLCVKTRKILHCNDTEEDPRVNKEACRKVQARSLVVAPLIHEGNAVGVLKILSKEANGFTEGDVQTLQLMAGFIGSGLAHQIFYEASQKLLQERNLYITELHKTQGKLKYLAEHDFLTTLPNRGLFTEALANTLQENHQQKQLHAIFSFDVDHFKSVNDTLGHAAGDALLKAFAQRVKKCY